jgi:hypothetical protein
VRTIRIQNSAAGKTSYTIEQGGLLRHIQHSFIAYGSSGNGGAVSSVVKLSGAGDGTSVGQFADGSLSHLELAYGNSSSFAGAHFTSWLDFVDVTVGDRALLTINHEAFAGVISVFRTALVLYLE